MKKIKLLVVLSFLQIGQLCAQSMEKQEIMNNQNGPDHYTFQLSNQVTRQKVTFKNRYGITLAGDLYLPKDSSNTVLALSCFNF
jgi:hypothetical protein